MLCFVYLCRSFSIRNDALNFSNFGNDHHEAYSDPKLLNSSAGAAILDDGVVV